jgi:hypothetical protein
MDAQNADGSQVTNAGAPDAGAQQQDGGNQAPGWIAQLPDDLKGNETFTGFKTIGELAKAHLDNTGKVTELEGKVANSIPKLSENATDEDKAAFRAALGVPESPDKYEFERPTMPDGIPYNEPLEQWFRNEAHKAGISGEAAKSLYNGFNNFSLAFLQSLEQQRTATLDAGMKALKEEWGGKFDEKVAIVKEVQKAIGLADPGMKEILSERNLENDPRLIKWLLNIAPSYLSDSAPLGRPGGGGATGDLDEQAKAFYKT